MAFRWNDRAGRYIDARGRFVSFKTIRSVVDDTLAEHSQQILSLAQQLRDGTISLERWQLQMMAESKSVHLYSAMAQRGGWAQLTPADYGRVGQIVRREYSYILRFGRQVASGEQRLDGTLIRRAELYVQAGRGTYHEFERVAEERKGMNEERRRLSPADHCDDCVAHAALGWQPIGTLPRIGDSQCLTKCQCYFEYRRVER